jgi:hypothetical protein
MRQPCIPAKILLILSLAALAPAACQTPGSGATALPDHITLTWTGDPSTTMTVTWRTDTSVTRGLVHYLKETGPADGGRQAEAAARDFTTDLGKSRLFSATLVHLSPNTRYRYRLGDGEHWSAPRSFTTADPQARSFKFLIFGDSQSPVEGEEPYALWRTTVRSAFRANPDAKFMVSMGDLVDLGQRGDHWNAWFAAAEGVIDTIPIMPLTGNHESYGSRETSKPAYWAAQFSLPQNGPEDLKGRVYSYDYGPVHFVVLDSQQEEQREYGDILEVQKNWLAADLAASRAVWKIVFFHKPPYGIMPSRPNEDVKAAFCPILDKHRVDLVFNAHDHGIARTYPIRDGIFFDNGSQGTVYYITGRSGAKTYMKIEKMPWNSFFYNPLDQPNYLVAEVTEAEITIRAVKQDGTVLDVFPLNKSRETDLDAPGIPEPAASLP